MTIYYAFMCEKGWLDFIGMAATRMSYRACLASAEILWGFVIMMSHKRNELFFIADALSLFLSLSTQNREANKDIPLRAVGLPFGF